jgi:prevent-host-death family protein
MKTRRISIGAFEAKNRFSELLEQVRHGTEITITKHDRPVARLVAAVPAERNDRQAAAQALRELAARHDLGGLSVRDLLNEGRR